MKINAWEWDLSDLGGHLDLSWRGPEEQKFICHVGHHRVNIMFPVTSFEELGEPLVFRKLEAGSGHCALLTCTLLALFALGAAQGGETWSEYGATASECGQRLTVSHTARTTCDTPDLCQQQARNVQHYHMREKGWCGVGYKGFLFFADHLLYQGRGWETNGAHTGATWNPISIGISFMGNYMGEAGAPARAIRAAQNLLSCGVELGALTRNYEVKGHRDVQQTLSPGDQLYALLRKWPHYRE
ncbi:peptidoglycan recognition protein 1-like [Trichechus manatus latirostris]|uniref:Peptidoglycan recognition protein 1 n=1 Tax=Trichechus manatus latirostris TaxID=127582 RepID=A0A2Y9R9B2_TRIMA|nr:peptidoglycan recognition protein 1-like [Trichechus manatus latirostris]